MTSIPSQQLVLPLPDVAERVTVKPSQADKLLAKAMHPKPRNHLLNQTVPHGGVQCVGQCSTPYPALRSLLFASPRTGRLTR